MRRKARPQIIVSLFVKFTAKNLAPQPFNLSGIVQLHRILPLAIKGIHTDTQHTLQRIVKRELRKLGTLAQNINHAVVAIAIGHIRSQRKPLIVGPLIINAASGKHAHVLR